MNHNNFIYQNIKLILFENKRLIKKLQDDLSYYDYYIDTTKTRLSVISYNVIKWLEKSQYSAIAAKYLVNKNLFDQKFKQIICDFKILKTKILISQPIVKNLIKYHQKVISLGLNIINEYLLISASKP